MRAASATVLITLALAACKEENHYTPPPPPRVTVAPPVSKEVQQHLEVTGSAAAVNQVELMARVSGFLQAINYTDGAEVTKGTTLFTIEPAPYYAQLQQAEGNVASQQGNYAAQYAQYRRLADLNRTDDASLAQVQQQKGLSDQAAGEVQQAEAQQQQAAITYTYTQVVAPFDGVVSAHLQSVGELVGQPQPTKLATIVQLRPIYVNFNVNEQDALNVRESLRKRGLTLRDIGTVPVSIGLMNETGFPHTGKLDYVAPTLDASTGTLAVRAIFDNTDTVLLPGNFVRVRVPVSPPAPALLVPKAAIGADQAGQYVLVVGADNVVAQRHVQLGQSEGELQVVASGLKPDEKVIVEGVQRAVPGAKVDPQPAPQRAAQNATQN